MHIEFLGSFRTGSLPEQPYPEIAVGGRSNVGKSSFINAILGRRKIARVSSKPGKTRAINLYLCNKAFILADLPGYGYSSAPKSEKARWVRDVEQYLTHRPGLKAMVLLVDIRHFPMPIDLEAIEWLSTLGRPLLVVLTKADKLNRSGLRRREADISGMHRGKHVEFVTFSAKTGLGKKEVWSWIERTARS